MSFHQNICSQAVEVLSNSSRVDIRLNHTLRLLSKWRSVLVANTLLHHEASRVLNGPFQGMNFHSAASEGCLVPKLLGCYEQPLHPFLEAAFARDYDVVLNIGSAEGYYAVGLALRMPGARICAFDISEVAREKSVVLARANNVAERVQVGGRFSPPDFEAHRGATVLVVCDIEGAERELLDPEKASALKHMDIIVESHDCIVSGTTSLLMERFQSTHEIELVADNGSRALQDPPSWFNDLAHLDQVLATWEWRSGPTPWLVMNSKCSRD